MRICINNEIDRVVIPCGHTFCNKCLQKNSMNYRNNNNINIYCPICRTEITNENKIYIY